MPNTVIPNLSRSRGGVAVNLASQPSGVNHLSGLRQCVQNLVAAPRCPMASKPMKEKRAMSLLKVIPIVMILSVPLARAAQQIGEAGSATSGASLSLGQILTNLEQCNAQRAAALEQFEGTRIYRM